MTGVVLHRLAKAALAVLALVVAPALAGWAVGGVVGAAAVILGGLMGALMALGAGWRHARAAVPAMAVALPVAGLLSGTWAWAALVTAIAAAGGAMSRHGLQRIGLTVALVAAVAPHAEGTRDAVVAAVLVVLGGLLGVQLARRAGAAETSPARETTPAHAAAVALGIGVATAVACALALWLPVAHGVWIPMTVLLVAMPSSEGFARHAGERLVGTVIGVVVLLPLGFLDLPRAASLALSLVCLVLALGWTRPTWLLAATSTMAVVLLLAPAEQTVDVASTRLLDTLIGIAVISAVVVLGRVLLPRPDDPLAIPPGPGQGAPPVADDVLPGGSR